MTLDLHLWTDAELSEVDRRLTTLWQVPRRSRGAWARPGLADSAGVLERRLLAVLRDLERDLVASLRGAADDVATGRLAGLAVVTAPAVDDAAPVDRDRLAALLLLLGAARLRYAGAVNAAVRDLLVRGYIAARPDAPLPGGVAAMLRRDLLLRYDGDVTRLFAGLGAGTPRAPGVEAVVGGAASVGEAVAALGRLFAGEEFRAGMLAEAATWWAFEGGFRAGAVERTRDDLATLGLDPDVVALAGVPTSVPRYAWSGPDDIHTCDPCREKFSDPVVARSLADLVAPSEVCRFGVACRHRWVEVEGV